jgi:hypothetical protein
MYRPNPAQPSAVFERILIEKGKKIRYIASVFDIGDDILEFLKPQWYDPRGEFIYEDAAVITVRRNGNGSVSSVSVRFTSCEIAERLLGNPPKAGIPRKRTSAIVRRRRVGPGN